jgi:hypothetical protein
VESYAQRTPSGDDGAVLDLVLRLNENDSMPVRLCEEDACLAVLDSTDDLPSDQRISIAVAGTGVDDALMDAAGAEVDAQLVRGTAPANQVLRCLDSTDQKLVPAGVHTPGIPARHEMQLPLGVPDEG